MSKWVSKDLFKKYQEEKEKETDDRPTGFQERNNVAYPAAGTADKPKVYEGRLLPDPKGQFTKKYYYHMWKSGDKMISYLCPKTDEFGRWCPMCTITSKLYTGTETDKKLAYTLKRKERHVTNWYVVDDPRDKEADSEELKMSGKVKVYEFPSKLESKIKQEVTDKKNGLGEAIFDPGPEGFNMIVKIKTTKPDKNNNTYPDYADSTFARKSISLGSESEIGAIMGKTYDLSEYINRMKMSDDDIQKILKNERLWEIVENDWNKVKGNSTLEANVDLAGSTTVKNKEIDVPDSIVKEDIDLLAELDKL